MEASTYIDAERIPQERIEAIARPALQAIRKAFEDPRVVEEFNSWLAQRAKKTEPVRGQKKEAVTNDKKREV